MLNVSGLNCLTHFVHHYDTFIFKVLQMTSGCTKKRPLKILHLQASGRDGKERPGKVQGKKERVGSGAAGTDETGTGDKSCYSIFMFNLKINR